ncbi:hypothetical protein KJ839_03935 [Patescibacteria group bacterium]|nr:hypothetical protein [Patescibacteria group bacterium]
MAFIKNVTIYKSKTTHVYINECHSWGKKTRLFAVRKNHTKGLAEYLGTIKFDGGWRQYVFEPDTKTKWSSSCGRGIFDFCDLMTQKWRKSIRKQLEKDND